MDQHKPLIVPIFSDREAKPLFRVECLNDTLQTIHPDGLTAIRLDGVEKKEPDPSGFVPRGDPGGVVGSMLGGFPSPVPPGGLWTFELALDPATAWLFRGRTTAQGTWRVDWYVASLAPGRHAVAVQCGGVWSEDVAFWWEPTQR